MEPLNKFNLTVFFEEPFWVGVFERGEKNKLSVCKITFGEEPTDSQIYAFILSHYNKLNFSKAIKAKQTKKADNLTAYESIAEFARKHNVNLTIMKNGEHWFHTKEQMKFLDEWIGHRFESVN